MEQGSLVEIDLDTLREEHQILDSERDLGLRRRVEEEVEDAKLEMERLCGTIDDAVGREVVGMITE